MEKYKRHPNIIKRGMSAGGHLTCFQATWLNVKVVLSRKDEDIISTTKWDNPEGLHSGTLSWVDTEKGSRELHNHGEEQRESSISFLSLKFWVCGAYLI